MKRNHWIRGSSKSHAAAHGVAREERLTIAPPGSGKISSLSRTAWTVGVGGLLIPLMLTVLDVRQGAAQETPWVAPAADRAVKNPVKVTPAGLKSAAELFQQTCSTCHGPKGMGDGILGKTLTPKPANFTDIKRMSKSTDGELFWKITNGRGPMPAWQQIPETDRWQLVNYIRTLSRRTTAGHKSTAAN
jgi:mono/diheme cytochrome c family protein